MLTATDEIQEALRKLRFVAEQHANTGDWYGCVASAISALEAALGHLPPGSAGPHADELPKYMVEAKVMHDRLERRDKFTDAELTYAATARCTCGAGLAYPTKIGPNGYWDCSAILRGEAAQIGQPGAVKHTDQLPFTFYEIKSEIQPSAAGETTRPK